MDIFGRHLLKAKYRRENWQESTRIPKGIRRDGGRDVGTRMACKAEIF
jgi:hypothetical protein